MSLFRPDKKLRAERDQATKAYRDLAKEAGELLAEKERQISVLQYKTKLPGIQLADMTERAKKRLSGYEVHLLRPEHNCNSCDEVETRINSSNMRMRYCTKHDHRVNAHKGNCPSHSNIKSKVA